MNKQTYKIRKMTDTEWQQLMQQYDKQIAEEKKELEEREKMFDEF